MVALAPRYVIVNATGRSIQVQQAGSPAGVEPLTVRPFRVLLVPPLDPPPPPPPPAAASSHTHANCFCECGRQSCVEFGRCAWHGSRTGTLAPVVSSKRWYLLGSSLLPSHTKLLVSYLSVFSVGYVTVFAHARRRRLVSSLFVRRLQSRFSRPGFHDDDDDPVSRPSFLPSLLPFSCGWCSFRLFVREKLMIQSTPLPDMW